jgi:hypothetical protein
MVDSLISGGFYVARLLERPDGLGTTPLPERLLTLSSCLTSFFPDEWAIEWASYSTEERASALRKLGMAVERLPEVVREMTEAMDTGELGWPFVWRSIEGARGAALRFGCDRQDFALLELGVPADRVADLIEHMRPLEGEGPTGFFERLSARNSVLPGGEPVGWELLGAEEGADFHSWLCNGLHDLGAARLGVTLGPFGLLRTEKDARAVDQLIASGIGAEPVPWFPGLLIRHEFAG